MSDDDPPFEDLLKDTKRLRAPHRVRVPPPRTIRPARGGDERGGSVRFEKPRADDPLLGFAPGLDRASFRRLRSGGWRPERRIDLHGLDRTGARARVRADLGEAWAAGERCVLVIHGRGRRSAAGAVLRDALPAWLSESPIAGRVLAFAPAVPEDGGSGATYVLLRSADLPR